MENAELGAVGRQTSQQECAVECTDLDKLGRVRFVHLDAVEQTFRMVMQQRAALGLHLSVSPPSSNDIFVGRPQTLLLHRLSLDIPVSALHACERARGVERGRVRV